MFASVFKMLPNKKIHLYSKPKSAVGLIVRTVSSKLSMLAILCANSFLSGGISAESNRFYETKEKSFKIIIMLIEIINLPFKIKPN